MTVNNTFMASTALPSKIVKYEGKAELYIIEDLNGQHLGYTGQSETARLYYAAPGMLEVIERMAFLCQRISESAVESAIRQEAVEILVEANTVLTAASKAKIE
ncbi:MAG: hypothetical protein HQL52_08195 [Magnetococcales bacterium]|nr:hypothetical protein [Magnetococcales bacterium]